MTENAPRHSESDQQAWLETARATLQNESRELQRVAQRLDRQFVEAVRLILRGSGKVVVSGAGKSGNVARQIAATLSSTGTPAVFLHPSDAAHGDLGLCSPGDPVVMVSNGGTTAELQALLTRLRAIENNSSTNDLRPPIAQMNNNLANRLSDLGRREEALERGEEAVGLYRQLAAERPDAFLPDLAMSLGTLNKILAALERHDEAADATGEGLRLLMPLFVKSPAAFAQLAFGLARDYTRESKVAGRELDTKLLQPLMEYLAKIEKEQAREPPDES